MKAFWRSVMANMTALALAALLLCAATFILFAFIVGTLLPERERPVVSRDSVLVINLSMNIPDAPTPPSTAALLQEAFEGGLSQSRYLLEVVEAIHHAAGDPNISALFLHGSLVSEQYGSGLGALGEIRRAVEAFQNTGKPVMAYAVEPSQRDYYVMSAASKLILNPYGVLRLNGLALNTVYFGNAFEQYGIGVQATRAGKYKSATEMFTGSEMSPADRLQLEALIHGLWADMLADIARGRGVDADFLQRISTDTGLFTADDARDRGLVDKVAYFDEVIGLLRQVSGESSDGFRQISLGRYLKASGVAAKLRGEGRGKAIAVVYAEGDIMPGTGSRTHVGGDWLARELRSLREDEDVRAVVLRVNSPGGSAVASEIILRELRATAAEKPVIVSLGSYAASGGYWISAYGNVIFVDPTTITGSIGVWGILFNVRDLANRHGITFDGVRTGDFADIHSLTRPKTAEEMALIQRFVDQLYDDFVAKVAEGRDLAIESVEAMAQGRLWSGRDALALGLADRSGGLTDAIAEASTLAGLENFRLVQRPRPMEWAESLMEMFGQDEDGLSRLVAADPLSRLLRQVRGDHGFLTLFSDPQGIYARLPYLLRWE